MKPGGVKKEYILLNPILSADLVANETEARK
jgi:hypothetical protein